MTTSGEARRLRTCSTCQRAANGPRLPHGGKRLHEATYCPLCLRERYVVRTIAIPVVEPIGATWQEFRGALTDSWAQVTRAANWIVTELYAHDVRRTGTTQSADRARAADEGVGAMTQPPKASA